jgi:hypothetical protein
MSKLLGLTLSIAMTASAAVKIEKTAYAGWPNCYRITNGEIELIVTTDVGPRVMRAGLAGGQNLFKEFQEQLGKSGEKDWQARGGHRLWVGPEVVPITYALDNAAVKIAVRGSVVELTQAVEKETGLQKQIILRMAAEGNTVQAVHRVRNTTLFPLDFAPWTLTMMAQGGVGITGLPPRGTHPKNLAPTNPLVIWPYTDFSDKRWTFTKKYIVLRQEPKNNEAQKLGHFNQHTWGAYLLGTDLFIKRYRADPAKTYPDFGCSYETFTNADFLELETVGPLTRVGPGQTVEHVENWSFHRNIKIGSWTDAELDRVLAPLVGK